MSLTCFEGKQALLGGKKVPFLCLTNIIICYYFKYCWRCFSWDISRHTLLTVLNNARWGSWGPVMSWFSIFMSRCTPVVVLLPPQPHLSHFHLLLVYLSFLVYLSPCVPLCCHKLGYSVLAYRKKNTWVCKGEKESVKLVKSADSSTQQGTCGLFSFAVKKKIKIKCSDNQSKQEPSERVRKSCKVGHKVGRTLIFPKVSPIAASLKWFLNSHECIAASTSTSIFRGAVSFLYGKFLDCSVYHNKPQILVFLVSLLYFHQTICVEVCDISCL